ncbi:MAG: hypothetical protein SF028_01515 [Candidatus Sumerlaeia bacterium]|nr:hypothetical protein [Candidatus Sumerlaeia bacterium]
MRTPPAVALALLAVISAPAHVSNAEQSNVDPAEQYAWAENIGWVNFRGDGANGVFAGRAWLQGFAWSENAGWINLGDGSPADGLAYSQAADDTGVNRDPGTGNLSGYAWGENIGWINFGAAAGADTARLGEDGNFAGYAWGENVGWINLASGFGVSLNRSTGAEGWILR